MTKTKNFYQVILLSFVMLLSIMCLAGCGEVTKTFSKSGIKITATTEFRENDVLNQTIYLASKDKVIGGVKEAPVANFPISTSLTSYTKLVIKANNLPSTTEIINFNEGGIVFDYFVFTKTEIGKEIKSLAITKKTETAFYVISFSSESKNFDKFLPTFMNWAKLVEVE